MNKVSRASSIAEDGVDFLTKSGPTVSVSVDGDDLDVEATHVFDLDPASLQEADCFSLAYRVAYNVFVAFPRLSDGVTTVAMFMTPKGVDDTPARNVKRFEVLRIVPNVNEEGRVLISTSACFVNPSTVGAPPTALPDMFASVSKRLAFPGDRAFPDANGERGPWVAAGTLVWDGLITDDVQVS